MPDSSRKAKLNDQHRAFIVRELACYRAPLEIQTELRTEYGIEVSHVAVLHYDPFGKTKKRSLSKRWADLFVQLRKTFVEHIEKHIPEANKAVRVQGLAEAAREYKARGNYLSMAQLYEQIAKEMGNVHTNRREFTGANGGPIPHHHLHEDIKSMTLDEKRAELAQLLGIDPGSVIDVTPEPQLQLTHERTTP